MLGNLVRFKFSVKNYYLFMSVFVVPILVYSVVLASIKPIIVFLIFAIFGVLGETFVSFWWQMFFGKRLWVYNTETFYHKYTSFLNFIPWGTGGFLYWIVARQVMPISQTPNLSFIFFLLFPALFVFQKLIFNLYRPYPHFKFHAVSPINLLFFYFPILIIVGLATFIYGREMLAIFGAFAIAATAAEYVFGKLCQSIISKKLWTYVYLPYDKGHFTPISIVLFGFGGFYFLILARMLGFF